ncbi:hypothetical protein UFOVP610_33 [uncultured Caudovirales phage]|uniref:Uncharacterized protein n=1 Tax=uncultured Caudovirales phage TaxID=2100421 RepID=A0A6J5N2C2_9CAUD|nr:hypothetical protein UFOVP610_33 [uncultured Caudovirales phage]
MKPLDNVFYSSIKNRKEFVWMTKRGELFLVTDRIRHIVKKDLISSSIVSMALMPKAFFWKEFKQYSGIFLGCKMLGEL